MHLKAIEFSPVSNNLEQTNAIELRQMIAKI